MEIMVQAVLLILAAVVLAFYVYAAVYSRPGPLPASSLLEPADEPESQETPPRKEWKTHAVGSILFTPYKTNYTAVVVHAVMEGDFYNVRLLIDPSLHMHVHASLLYTREEIADNCS